MSTIRFSSLSGRIFYQESLGLFSWKIDGQHGAIFNRCISSLRSVGTLEIFMVIGLVKNVWSIGEFVCLCLYVPEGGVPAGRLVISNAELSRGAE